LTPAVSVLGAGSTVDCMVEACARAAPDDLACAAPGRSLTYGELDARACTIAAALASRTVEDSEPVVAVALDRSLDFVPAILGCWKAGAAYLPIGSDVPLERITFMLHDSQAHVVVTDAGRARALERLDAELLVVDDIRPGNAGGVSSAAEPQALAYVIYTSGSTGRPKAVAVEHRNLLSYVRAVVEALELPRGTCWAAVSSFATDLAHTALYLPLATGGCVHVVPRKLAVEATQLERYFEKTQVDSLKITPTHLAALLRGHARPLPSDRLVIGGERLSPALVSRIRELRPGCTVYNHYGPTETTVGVCLHRTGATADADESVPIGRPLPATHVYVLDEGLRPVADGEVGELFIGGAGVARGYLGLPGSTAASFLPDPAGSGRMYRTGDLVRRLPGGDVVFLGRRDDQVKIRGHRVELGEVEAALARHQDVQHAVVALDDDAAREGALEAHVVPKAGATPTSDALRRFLRDTLPAHMVPTRVAIVGALPLLPSGKVDRVALRSVEPAEPDAPAGAPAATSLVDVVSAIYREVLGDASLGADDDFFDSGGDSLLAVRAAARLEEVAGLDVRVASLFVHPTAAELAASLTAAVPATAQRAAD
jgi:amino acid adenylation domain-containing protein